MFGRGLYLLKKILDMKVASGCLIHVFARFLLDNNLIKILLHIYLFDAEVGAFNLLFKKE
jgi:hypothetical protein